MKTLSRLLLMLVFALPTVHAWAGVTQANNPNGLTKHDSSDGCGCGSSKGMPVYSFKSLLASLNIRDTPVGYTPPLGPKVETTLTYNERETLQPTTFDSFNVGQKWTLNWLSWIQDNPSAPGSQVLRYVAGGGGWNYSGYNASTGAFAPEPDNGAVLVMTSRSPIVYELRYADGHKDIFAESDGATSYPRRVLLTQIVDAQGNALTLSYDSQHRLTTVTDAIGQQTTFTYGNTADPNLVTRITDPFGRHADLTYDDQGRLHSITDVMGMTSSFAYDSGTFVKAMTTPYGTTTFAHTEGAHGNSTELSIQATDPDGHTERTEYLPGAPGMPFSVAQAPSGMNTFNAYLNYRASYYWDKDAFAAACTVSNGTTNCDYSKARMKHFLHVNPCCYYTSRVLENVKYPLEGLIWYDYGGQTEPYYPGTLNLPSDVGRVLDDGSSQVTHYTYNAYGKVTTRTGPDGRQTVYTYAANGIDLIQVQQKVASGYATLASYTYNNQHEPLTYTDAGGGTTTYTYNAQGQRTSVTDPLGHTTKYQYDNHGYLVAVIDALGNVAQHYTYDAEGRVASSTDAEGYTRNFQYDALDRLTQITYPDGTSTHYVWNRLDLASVTDRQGNTTQYSYDAERNLITVTDSLGQTTRYTYYPNGKRHTMTDPNGNVTTWTRDLEGRVVAKTYADGKGSTYSYDNSSRLASTTDALGQTTAYGYDRADELTSIQYQHAVNPTAAVSLAYDPYYPRRISMTDGIGTTGFSYVPVGQPGALKLAGETGPFGTNDSVSYDYDALGRITGLTTAVASSYSYDPLGRLSQEHNPLGTFDYSYLGDTDQLTWRLMTAPNGQPGLALSQDYESNRGDRQLRRLMYFDGHGHRLTTLQDYRHSPEHLLTAASMVLPSLASSHAHDHDGEDHPSGDRDARHWGHASEGDDAEREGHDHDDWDHGHRTWGYGGFWRYRYDNAYRLTAVRHGRHGDARFDYDAAGNLLGASGTASPFTATANNLNQLATVNGQAWQYDADGHLIDDGTHTYSWDAAGRLIGVTDQATGQVTAYRYDGLGRRVEITVSGTAAAPTDTRYLWCGSAVCEMTDARGNVTADLFTQGELRGANALYYVRDQLGSVIGVANAEGRLQGTARYDAYGSTTSARGTRADVGYAGMLHDPASSLYLTLFRAYDPSVGRWLSRDPIGELGGENIYAYTGDNPINGADAYGLWTVNIGISGSINIPFIGPVGIGGGGYAGIVWDGTHFAWYYGGGGGVGGGAGGSLGIQIGGSNAATVCDLRGPFLSANVSGGEGLIGGVEGYRGSGSHGQSVTGGNLFIGGGGGTPASGWVGVTGTGVHVW